MFIGFRIEKTVIMKLLIGLVILMQCFCLKGQEEKDYQLSGIRKYTYNENGSRVEKLSYDTLNSLIKRVLYRYDDRGNKIKTEKYLADSSLLATYEYEFNQKNQKVASVKTDCVKGIKTSKRYYYNNAGQNSNTEYYINNKLTKIVQYKYDEYGNQIEYKVCDDKEEQIALFFTENKYDETGKLLEKFKRNTDGELVKMNQYSYNKDSQIIESLTLYYKGKRDNSKRSYQYDEEGRKVGFIKYTEIKTTH